MHHIDPSSPVVPEPTKIKFLFFKRYRCECGGIFYSLQNYRTHYIIQILKAVK